VKNDHVRGKVAEIPLGGNLMANDKWGVATGYCHLQGNADCIENPGTNV
jgi:hypothetical protein